MTLGFSFRGRNLETCGLVMAPPLWPWAGPSYPLPFCICERRGQECREAGVRVTVMLVDPDLLSYLWDPRWLRGSVLLI